MRFWRNQRGDTIVEVLIAMAVTSAVLGGAYAVVNRTMMNSQQAQEHAQALQIANQQVERIAAIAGAPTGSGDIYDNTPIYNCANLATGQLVPQHSLTDLNDASSFAQGCTDSGSVPFRVAFRYYSSVTMPYFRVTVIWPAASGDGEDRVSLVYRAFRP